MSFNNESKLVSDYLWLDLILQYHITVCQVVECDSPHFIVRAIIPVGFENPGVIIPNPSVGNWVFGFRLRNGRSSVWSVAI